MHTLKISALVLVSTMLFCCKNYNPVEEKKNALFNKTIDTANLMLDSNSNGALQYVENAYRQIRRPTIHINIQRHFFRGKVFSFNKKDHPIAFLHIDSAIDFAESRHVVDLNEINYVYILKAQMLLDEKRHAEALQYYYKAKKNAESTHNNIMVADINSKFGNFSFAQQKYALAIHYFTKAKNIYQTIPSSDVDSNIIPTFQMMNNIGVSYERLAKYDDAIKNYQASLNYINLKSDKLLSKTSFIKLAKENVFGNLGSAWLGNGNTAQAIFFIKKGLSYNNYHETKEYKENRIKLAKAYIINGKQAKAAPIIKEFEDYFKTYPNEHSKIILNDVKWRYYFTKKDMNNAFRHIKLYHQLKDSIDRAQDEFYNIDFMKEFEKIEKENEIREFKMANRQQLLYLAFAIGILILSVATIFLIAKNNRTIKEHNKDLTNLNQEISNHNLTMQKTLEALEQSQEQNSKVMKVLAHDMRTPIAGIKGLTDFLLTGGELNEEQEEIISMINSSSIDGLNFLNDLLQADTNLKTELVELSSLIKYCVTLLKAKAQEKSILLDTKIQAIELHINREKIWRVLSNLISNAIKFSKSGSKVLISIDPQPASVLITIKDEGIGIPAQFRERIFDMSPDIQRQGTEGEKSFGLGLAISKQIIEAHHGKIWFNTKVGIGTEFFIELPLDSSKIDLQV